MTHRWAALVGWLVVCLAVPDAPGSVQIVTSLPTEIRVAVELPHEDGGMPVTGYRVEYEDQAQDFDVGQSVTFVDVALISCLYFDFGVVSALDSGAEEPGFKSQSRHCRVTVLGKLFTPIVPPFTKQQNW